MLMERAELQIREGMEQEFQTMMTNKGLELSRSPLVARWNISTC